jgi:octaprenyl-diphosphate synthase
VECYREYLREDLALVQEHIDAAFRVEGRLMGEVAAYVGQSRGKMLRPAVHCLVARGLGYNGRECHHTRIGAALEIFHLATLLHDDVIDNAPLRRRRPTVNARWGNDVAILFADYLYASCFDLALAALQPEIVRILTSTTRRMTEGEMYQIELRGEWLKVEDYFSIIRSKTAYLFSASAALGAVLAGQDADMIDRMAQFGLNFGLAFQITDDALDYEAQSDAWGKRVGSDLAEGKQTLPLLHTLQVASESDRAKLLAILKEGRDFETVHRYVRHYNGIDYSLERAAEFTRDAQRCLEGLDSAEPFAILRQMTEGVLVRQS